MSKADMFAKVETVRVEITPGYFIDVNPKSINPSKTRVRLNRAKNHDIEKHRIFSDAFRAQNKVTKYSSLILDEAVSLALKKGMRYAVKKTGVKYWSIVQRKRRLRLAGLLPAGRIQKRGSRYTMEIKRRCVALAFQLMADPEMKTVKTIHGKTRQTKKWAQRPAFIEAGRRLNINGRSVEHMYVEGMIR